MLLDFHSHISSENSIVCTDTPDEMPSKKALLRCLGLLPDKWSQSLEDKLCNALSNDKSLQLGEVGLDRRFEKAMSMHQQTEALEREIRFAISRGRSVSLHCVRETGRMIKLLSELKFRPFSILWHGFSGSAETAAELYRMRIIISIGPNFHCDIQKLFQAKPMLALETDYTGSDENEHQRILQTHHHNISLMLGLKSDQLEKHCANVFTAFCGRSLCDIE